MLVDAIRPRTLPATDRSGKAAGPQPLGIDQVCAAGEDPHPNLYVGATQTGAATLNADLADAYADFATFVDLSYAPNLARFRSANGKPVDLGPSCTSADNGGSPIACFNGPAATWYLNQGTGGGMTEHGTEPLAAAMTSPSD